VGLPAEPGPTAPGPIQDNRLFSVADAFAAGALVLNRPEFVDTYARPLFEYGAANQFYPGSFVGYHSIKEYVNQVGFGYLFLYAWWRIHVMPPLTDDPLTARSTVVKAEHFVELRAAIGTLRTRFSLGVFAWTDATIVAGVTPVKAAHLTERWTALNQVYVAAGRPAPSYTNSVITAGATVMTAVDIVELRAAILAFW
jgi:hypothetical protein